MAKMVLARDFYANDGTYYARKNAVGDLIVYDFPDGLVLPSTAQPAPDTAPAKPLVAGSVDPRTMKEISKATAKDQAAAVKGE